MQGKTRGIIHPIISPFPPPDYGGLRRTAEEFIQKGVEELITLHCAGIRSKQTFISTTYIV